MAHVTDTEYRTVSLDELAFEALFNKYWDAVFSVCLKYTGSAEDSRELTQDIFYSLWQRREHLEIKSTISAYLHGAAKLKSFEFMRSRGRAKEKAVKLAVHYEDEDHFSAHAIEYKELSANILRFVDHLPEPGKSIFCLSRNEGLSHKEIAAQTGFSVGMVEYYMGIVLRILRSKLKALS